MQRYGENNDFQIGIDVANDAAEDAGDTEIFLNVEISEDAYEEEKWISSYYYL